MTLHWFLSKTARQALEMVKHVQKLLNSQRDILSQEAIEKTQAGISVLESEIKAKGSKTSLEEKMKNLETVGNKNLKPYPNPGWRENVEVLLVAIAVAMGIRTFFLQPFKIPTGSMQPTLYGVEYEPFNQYPSFGKRVWDAIVEGGFYHYKVAEHDGVIEQFGQVKPFLRAINRQSYVLAYNVDGQVVRKTETLWFGPDDDAKLRDRMQLFESRQVRKGEPYIKIKEYCGDHLFVNRLTYNFRHPRRGEIIVFKTKGINPAIMRQDQFYIKRLVVLGGEKVIIGDDQHTRINGQRLTAATPHFENVFTFGPVPKENYYFGHVNQATAMKLPDRYGNLSPLFPGENMEPVEVRPNHYMVFGDNTLHSFDSRGWGDFPRENVIGKSFFVYWPISNHRQSRFGWSHR